MITEVDRNEIKPGDMIICDDGEVRTVCKKDIHNSDFMGVTIFGDSYKLGYKKVKKFTFEEVEKNREYISRTSQLLTT